MTRPLGEKEETALKELAGVQAQARVFFVVFVLLLSIAVNFASDVLLRDEFFLGGHSLAEALKGRFDWQKVVEFLSSIGASVFVVVSGAHLYYWITDVEGIMHVMNDAGLEVAVNELRAEREVLRRYKRQSINFFLGGAFCIALRWLL